MKYLWAYTLLLDCKNCNDLNTQVIKEIIIPIIIEKATLTPVGMIIQHETSYNDETSIQVNYPPSKERRASKRETSKKSNSPD